jgi:hypothetical protein
VIVQLAGSAANNPPVRCQELDPGQLDCGLNHAYRQKGDLIEWGSSRGGPVLRRAIHEAGAFGIDVHVIAHRELPPAAASKSSAAKES